jgi:hypothetical protein
VRDDPFRVLVLGGYGHFGSRICRALAPDPAIELTVAGRDAARAEQFAAGLATGATAPNPPAAAAIDHQSRSFRTALAALRPNLLIHNAGPFQGQDYSVAEACIDAGVHYVDLADGRAFVCGIEILDARARSRDVLVVSGSSTLPAVSSAVIDALCAEFDELAWLTDIEIGIAPPQRIPRGEATLASILSYCGKPFQQLEHGSWREVYGWQAIRRVRFRSLGTRWMAACDVPDLELFPRRYRGVHTVRFEAGLELAALQWGLWLMAVATRLRLVADWSRHARWIQRVATRFDRFGSDVGGMHVALTARAPGARPRRVAWEMTAREGHGPEIPSIPAVILARKLAAGAITARGAMPCVGLFSLEEFAAATAPFAMTTSVRRMDTPLG